MTFGSVTTAATASASYVGELEHDFHVVLDQMLAEMQEKIAKQEHPKVTKDFGEWHTNKKSNAFAKSDQQACERVFLSAIIRIADAKMGCPNRPNNVACSPEKSGGALSVRSRPSLCCTRGRRCYRRRAASRLDKSFRSNLATLRSNLASSSASSWSGSRCRVGFRNLD
jgi:hypothetical protein